MTELYIFDRKDGPLPEEAERLLPAWRRERLAQLKNPSARQESLAAGLLWRFAVENWGVSPDAEIVRLPAGKPVLSEGEGPWFSLSHSGRYVLCAVSSQSVGADVQEPRPISASMERFFHPEERRTLSEASERESAFFRLWARKEAWVKAVSGERMLSLGEADVLHPLPGLFFRDYDLPDGFQAALCAGEDGLRDPIWVSREELTGQAPAAADVHPLEQEENS